MLTGIITNLRGASKFYVRDSKGNVKELKVGDEHLQINVEQPISDGVTC